MGSGANHEDKVRTKAPHDVEPKAHQQELTEEPDKFGLLARNQDDAEAVDDIIRSMEFSFVWFNEAAQTELEKLRRDIGKKDEPDWADELAVSLLGVALGGGAAGAGAFLAKKLMTTTAGPSLEAFVATLFEEGVKEGVSAGKSKLVAGRDQNVADPFIDSQKEAVWVSQMKNQSAFVKNARKHVTTLEQARTLERACSHENMKDAAKRQYSASRDAWVTYLAQAQLGVVGDYGPVRKYRSSLDDGPLSTNMMTEKQRDKARKKWDQSQHGEDSPYETIPESAPTAEVPGVLSVFVRLPQIKDHEMKGVPKIEHAFLGVNDAIRQQYENVPLVAMSIPRHIVAEVNGAPDFTINLDEQGNYNQIEEKRRMWLRLRATAAHATGKNTYAHDHEAQLGKQNSSRSGAEQEHEGLRLLLEELVPSKIKKSVL